MLTNNQLRQARAKLGQRAESGIPLWPVAPRPCAMSNATVLLLGSVLGKLPADDVAALCRPMLDEQDAAGSWGGSLSQTLEIVQALSQVNRSETRPAMDRAIRWLEARQAHLHLHPETLALLGYVTGLGLDRALARWLKPFVKAGASYVMRHASGARRCALRILWGPAGRSGRCAQELIRMQQGDGSWDGDVRATALAMAALRHAGLASSDSLFERGFRFMRALEQWDGDALVQAPRDVSTWLHAAAIRGLLLSGAEPAELAPSVLALLHAQTQSGGFALGSGQRPDVMTTARALEALSIFGDIPVETAWSRRRAIEFLCAAQLADGSWPRALRARGSFRARGVVQGNVGDLDVTVSALFALALAGDSASASRRVLDRAVRYVSARQERDGSYPAGLMRSKLWTTVAATEAIEQAGFERRPVERALAWIQSQQHVLGGFTDRAGLTTLATCHGIRGLTLRPLRFARELAQARTHLLLRRDDETLLWPAEQGRLPAADAARPLPDTRSWDSVEESYGFEVDELTSLAALEAMSVSARSRRLLKRKARRPVPGAGE